MGLRFVQKGPHLITMSKTSNRELEIINRSDTKILKIGYPTHTFMYHITHNTVFPYSSSRQSKENISSETLVSDGLDLQMNWVNPPDTLQTCQKVCQASSILCTRQH